MQNQLHQVRDLQSLCSENNVCTGSGLELNASLTPTSSNTVLSQGAIKIHVAHMAVVGISSQGTTGAGQDMCRDPSPLAL